MGCDSAKKNANLRRNPTIVIPASQDPNFNNSYNSNIRPVNEQQIPSINSINSMGSY